MRKKFFDKAAKLTLNQAINIARAHESSGKELEAVTSKIHEENPVRVVRKSRIQDGGMQDHRNSKPSRVLNHRGPKNTAEHHRNTKPINVSTVEVLTQDQRDVLQKGNPAITVIR